MTAANSNATPARIGLALDTDGTRVTVTLTPDNGPALMGGLSPADAMWLLAGVVRMAVSIQSNIDLGSPALEPLDQEKYAKRALGELLAAPRTAELATPEVENVIALLARLLGVDAEWNDEGGAKP